MRRLGGFQECLSCNLDSGVGWPVCVSMQEDSRGGGLLRTLAFASEAISISSSRMPTRSCAIRRAPLLPQADIYIYIYTSVANAAHTAHPKPYTWTATSALPLGVEWHGCAEESYSVSCLASTCFRDPTGHPGPESKRRQGCLFCHLDSGIGWPVCVSMQEDSRR